MGEIPGVKGTCGHHRSVREKERKSDSEAHDFINIIVFIFFLTTIDCFVRFFLNSFTERNECEIL